MNTDCIHQHICICRKQGFCVLFCVETLAIHICRFCMADIWTSEYCCYSRSHLNRFSNVLCVLFLLLFDFSFVCSVAFCNQTLSQLQFIIWLQEKSISKICMHNVFRNHLQLRKWHWLLNWIDLLPILSYRITLIIIGHNMDSNIPNLTLTNNPIAINPKTYACFIHLHIFWW